MTMHRSFFAGLVLLSAHGLTQAFGASPDAGALMQANDQAWAERQVPAMEALPPEYNPRLRWNDNFSVRIESIQIAGNRLLPDSVLQDALKPFKGKRLAVESVPRLARFVTQAYKNAGYRVKAYVPEQSFSDNRVLIQVIEPTPMR